MAKKISNPDLDLWIFIIWRFRLRNKFLPLAHLPLVGYINMLHDVASTQPLHHESQWNSEQRRETAADCAEIKLVYIK